MVIIEKDNPSVCARVYLLGELSVERRTPEEAWDALPAHAKEWGTNGNARSLLRYLLSNGRRASRSTIIEALWPEVDSADKYLNNAASTLRNILGSDEQLETIYSRTSYRLADQSRLWVDLDWCEAVIDHARTIGHTTPEGLALLQEAEATLSRGPFLAGEPGDWCLGMRENVVTMHYRCTLWLAEAYEAQQEWSRAEKLVELLLRKDPTDENALCLLMRILHTQGLTSEALRRYKRASSFIKQQGLVLSSETEALARELQSRPRVIISCVNRLTAPVGGDAPENLDKILSFTSLTSQELENRDMDPSRRHFLEDIGVLGVNLLVPSSLQSQIDYLFEDDVPELSKETIANLATITQQFRDLQRCGVPFIVKGVNAHLLMLQKNLERAVDDTVRCELWRLLAQTQLIVQFNRTRKTVSTKNTELAQAKTAYEVMVASAQYSSDTLLTGAAIGHFAQFYLREVQDTRKAAELISQAKEYIPGHHPLNGWLALLMASISAKEGSAQNCERYLADAMMIAYHLPNTQEYVDIYYTDFSRISVSVFTINCWLTLQDAKQASAHVAQINLEALSDNRRASAFYDASRAYASIGAFDIAQSFAIRAIDKATLTQQLYIIPRCSKLAATIKQKEPHEPHATAIDEYARAALKQRREGYL